MVVLLLNLITCYYFTNCGMIMLGVRYREKMTLRDMRKATLGQSRNRDIPCSKCSTRICTFMHLGVKGLKQRCHWRDRQLYLEREYLVGMINPLT